MTEEERVLELIKEWAEKVSQEPIIESLLYDAGLLPEQINNMRDLVSMIAVIVAFEEGYNKGFEENKFSS